MSNGHDTVHLDVREHINVLASRHESIHTGTVDPVVFLSLALQDRLGLEHNSDIIEELKGIGISKYETKCLLWDLIDLSNDLFHSLGATRTGYTPSISLGSDNLQVRYTLDTTVDYLDSFLQYLKIEDRSGADVNLRQMEKQINEYRSIRRIG